MTENETAEEEKVLRLSKDEYRMLSGTLKAEADMIVVDGVIVKDRYGRAGFKED